MLYLATLAPTVYNLDSAELTTAAATGGLVHPTGYPLYLIIGGLWSRLPLGDVGYRMNLLSAVSAALTIALLERLLHRWQIGGWASLGTLGLLASAPHFWSLALVAEVYTLHTALMAGCLLLLLRWGDAQQPRRLIALALLLGLSLTHHAASLLLLPGCLWFMLTRRPRERLSAGALLAALATLLAGLSLYLLLPLRYRAMPAFNYAGAYDASLSFQPVDLASVAGLWWMISGQVFGSQMFAYSLGEHWQELLSFLVQLWRAFFAIGLGPGLLGLGLLLRRDWRLAGTLLLMFGANVLFYSGYRVADKELMFLPAYLIWALWLAIGYQWLLDSAHALNQQRLRQVSLLLLRGTLLGAVLLAGATHWRAVDRSGDWSARQRGEQMLRQAEPHALILGHWDTVPVIQYLQLVEGQRPDVLAINYWLIRPADVAPLIVTQASLRPLYVDRLPVRLPEQLQHYPAGLLLRIAPRAALEQSTQGGAP